MAPSTAEVEEYREYDRHILEVLPRDSHICRLFQEGVDGKRQVKLVVKGFRPMYRKNVGPNCNFFTFNEPGSIVPVPTICRLVNVDPTLVEDAYFHFRNVHRWPTPCPELDLLISLAQTQVVTNIFPFPEIQWCVEEGNGIGYINLLRKMRRTAPFLSEREIRLLSQPCKKIAVAKYGWGS